MTRLTDLKDEEAIEVLADILVPVSELAQDDEIKKIFSGERTNKTIAEVASLVIGNHASAVMDILAALDRVPREDYHCNILTLPLKVIEILNDPTFMTFFTAQGQIDSLTASGSAMESTEEEGH